MQREQRYLVAYVWVACLALLATVAWYAWHPPILLMGIILSIPRAAVAFALKARQTLWRWAFAVLMALWMILVGVRSLLFASENAPLAPPLVALGLGALELYLLNAVRPLIDRTA